MGGASVLINDCIRVKSKKNKQTNKLLTQYYFYPFSNYIEWVNVNTQSFLLYLSTQSIFYKMPHSPILTSIFSMPKSFLKCGLEQPGIDLRPCIRDGMRSLVIWEGLRVQPVKVIQATSMPPSQLLGGVFQACPTERRPKARPGTRCRCYVNWLAQSSTSVSSSKSWRSWSGERDLRLDCCPCDPNPDK